MTHRIIVLGGGYSGALAAGRLARRLHRDDVAITLVNARPDFVERVRLHQVTVTGVDADRKTVTVVDAGGVEELGYDTLVYALGSGWTSQAVPGAAEHAAELASRPGALRLRERLARLDAVRPDLDVALGRLGITVHERAVATAVEADRVVTADGEAIPAAVTAWTTGFAVPPIARATTLQVTGTGQIGATSTSASRWAAGRA
jgi:NADH:ubiquinone reductase (H+-translocating)